MSVGIQPTAVLSTVSPTFEARVTPTAPVDPTAASPSALVDPMAAAPRVDRVELSDEVMPPELHPEIEFAFQRALELASHNRELHFSKDEDSGRIVVQVRDLDGEVIRTIPSSDALAVMSGKEI